MNNSATLGSDAGWVENLLSAAIEQRASDIHIEPSREEIDVRIRVDGQLRHIQTLDKSTHEPLVSRIKVLSQMDIAEHRAPQDGHFEFTSNQTLFSVRVSTIPTIHGEAAVLRLHIREGESLNLKELGFDASQMEVVQKLLTQPSGMVLSTGPNGSGKTTLLYACLQVLNKPTANIITVEDPVERQLKGVRQIQVTDSGKLTFTSVLRSILRQDPDVIMVGEIRDPDSAQISVQAALTGRLVFSTIHTFNVFAVIARFMEMGIPRSIIANSINAIISPRLIRKICQNCRVRYQPTEPERKFFDLGSGAYFTGSGCNVCYETGYAGRVGVFEIVPFDQDIRLAIVESKNISDVLKVVKIKKHKTLLECAIDKVKDGTTTVAELIRVVGV